MVKRSHTKERKIKDNKISLIAEAEMKPIKTGTFISIRSSYTLNCRSSTLHTTLHPFYLLLYYVHYEGPEQASQK